jgi:hypothetical protein
VRDLLKDKAMAHTPKETKTSPQMSAAIADRVTSPRDTTQSFGRIGIPALAAAAEIVKSSRKAEKPFHADFYRQFVD